MKINEKPICPKCGKISRNIIIKCGKFEQGRHCVDITRKNECRLNLNPPCNWCKHCFLHFHAWSVS